MKAQHQLFVDNYIKTQNATKAALAAGYSEKSAHTQGSRLLKRSDIQGALVSHTAKTEKKVASLADRVLKELEKMAFSNMQDLFDPQTGKLLPINKMPRDVAATLTAFENDKGFQKVKTASKLTAIETLAKILGLVKPDTQQQAVQIIIRQAPDTVGQPAITPGTAPLQLQPEW